MAKKHAAKLLVKLPNTSAYYSIKYDPSQGMEFHRLKNKIKEKCNIDDNCDFKLASLMDDQSCVYLSESDMDDLQDHPKIHIEFVNDTEPFIGPDKSSIHKPSISIYNVNEDQNNNSAIINRKTRNHNPYNVQHLKKQQAKKAATLSS